MVHPIRRNHHNLSCRCSHVKRSHAHGSGLYVRDVRGDHDDSSGIHARDGGGHHGSVVNSGATAHATNVEERGDGVRAHVHVHFRNFFLMKSLHLLLRTYPNPPRMITLPPPLSPPPPLVEM